MGKYTKLTNDELEKLVSNGDTGAYGELGIRNLFGLEGLNQNKQRAYQLFHKGEKNNELICIAGLEYMYRNGVFFIANLEEAEKYELKIRSLIDVNSNEYYEIKNVFNVNGNTQDYNYESHKSENHYNNNQYYENIIIDNNRKELNNVNTISGESANNKDLIEKTEYLLLKSEEYRLNEEYEKSIASINKALEILNRDVYITEKNEVEVDKLKAEAYYKLVFIGFSNANYSMIEENIEKPNVIALHPYAVYLRTISHKIQNFDESIIMEDINVLIDICQNPNMNPVERSNVFLMIGDYYDSASDKLNKTEKKQFKEEAKKYYIEAEALGNNIASEKLKKMKKIFNFSKK